MLLFCRCNKHTFKPLIMKLVLILSILSFSFLASANSDFFESNANNTEMTIGNDRGKKKRKKSKVNRRRKKKCNQFQRRVYAG